MALSHSREVRKRASLFAGLVLALTAAACTPPEREDAAAVPQPAERPNVVVILADDLAYSDIGRYGSEIATPHLDRLAEQGIAFSAFHTSPMCSPTRAMLLTGVAQHKTGYGSMEEFLTEDQRGKPGYEGYLNDRVVTVARLLKDAGYRTYMTGKWHLGIQSLPSARGFEETYILVDGAGSHFDDAGYGFMRPKARYRQNGEPVVPPEGFYSSDFYTERMIDFIREGKKDGEPFFGYLAFSAPHWPLHAPADLIAKYDTLYRTGWDAWRRERFERQKALGIISETAVMPPRLPTVPAWDTLPEEERLYEARKMAVFAAMVERLDWNVGRLMAFLEQEGMAENTVVVFLSDNGPEAIDFNRRPIFPPATDWIAENFDNSYEKLGGPESYIFYGEPWAQMGASAHRYYKTVVTQGGIHGPLILSYPGGIEGGRETSAFATVLDIAPTLLELTGVAHPGTEHAGRAVHAMDGRSMLSHLKGDAPAIHAEGEGVGFELFGNEAFIDGTWKITRLRPPLGDGEWALYDIAADPGELDDLSDRHPARLRELIEAYAAYSARSGVIPPPESWRMFGAAGDTHP